MARYREPRHYQLHAARVVDRELSEDTLGLLKAMPGVTLERSGFNVVYREFPDGDVEHQYSRMSDMYLLFDRGGERTVTFRFPVSKVALEDVKGYLVGKPYDTGSLTAEVDGESLYVRWGIYGEDNEGATPGWTGEEWPDLILPVRKEILKGDYTALEIGPLLKDWCDPTEPGRPAEGGVSKAVRNLIAFMCIEPPAFNAWARKRAPKAKRASG
jgi:hypothetical protein